MANSREATHMIDVGSEKLITLEQAARLRPPGRNNRPTHVPTIYRWCECARSLAVFSRLFTTQAARPSRSRMRCWRVRAAKDFGGMEGRLTPRRPFGFAFPLATARAGGRASVFHPRSRDSHPRLCSDGVAPALCG